MRSGVSLRKRKKHVKVRVMEKNMIIWFTHLRTLTATMLVHWSASGK